MAIGAIDGSVSTYRNENSPTTTAGTEMSLTDFYTLLAAELKYQSPDDPADTSEMMSSMVQMQMVSAITQMTSMNTTTYATSMVGKQVTVAEMDDQGRYKTDTSGAVETKTGTVTGVVLGDSPLIFVDGKSYTLSQIVSVGEIPETNETDKGDGQKGDDTTKNDPTEGTGGESQE